MVANGDYSCDSIFVGLSDDAAFESASECLGKLRARFGSQLLVTLGDHELGKLSLAGHRGGCAWGVGAAPPANSAWPPFGGSTSAATPCWASSHPCSACPGSNLTCCLRKRPEWERLRERHLEQIRQTFSSFESDRRVILFCHDPTGLPFLWKEELVRAKVSLIEQTIIGHLHTNLVLREARLLAGMPVIGFLGHSVRRMTSALHEARHWRPFHVRLCPSLAGVELLKDGGFYRVELDLTGGRPARFQFCRMKRA